MAEDLKNLESTFDPREELRSFTQQLTTMRKSVKDTISKMKTEIGTGIIDMSQVKKQFKDLENFVNKESLKLGDKTSKAYTAMTKNFISANNELLRGIQRNNVYKILAEQGVEARKLLDDAFGKVGTMEFADAYKEAMESVNEIRDANRDLIKQAKDEGILKTRAINQANQINDALELSIKMRQVELDKVAKINDQLVAAREAIDDFVDKSFAFFEKIPGGGYFQKALGLEKVKEQIMGNVGEALKKSIDKGVSALPAFHMAVKGVVATYLQFAKMLLLNPWTIALIGIALLIKQFVDLESAGEDFRRSTGLTLALTKQLTPNVESAALSMRKYGVSVEDTYNAAAALYSKFQNIQVVTPTLIKTVALMEAKLGVSNENAAQVLETFMSMKDVSKDTVKYWVDTTSQLSHAAGVAPAQVFNDIAQNSELIATYMGASVEEIIKTAVNARKLGLELEDVGSIVDSAMNWESSIEKELEASILLGRQINFNAARQKIFQGDIDGAAKEILSQVGSLEKFNNMNYIQKKAIADATGLSVSKLQESLSIQKKLNELTPKQRIQYDAQQKELEQINSTVTDLKNSFAAIGASLGRVVLPIINMMRPAVKQLAEFVGLVADGINGLIDGVDKLIPGSKEFTAQLAGWPLLLLVAKKPLTGLMGMFGKLFSLGGSGAAAKTIEKTTGAVGGIGKSINPTSMLKAAASILIISGALWVFAKALQEIEKVKDITKALIGATIGLVVLSTVALALGSASPAMLLGALTIGVLAGALWLLGEAIDKFVPMVDTLLKGIGVIIEVVGNAITKVVTAIADSFVKLSGLGPGLATTAMAIYALSGALAAFLLVSTTGSFANMFAGVFGDSPIDQLERLASIGPGLMMTATALKQISAIASPELAANGNFEEIGVTATPGGLGDVILESNDKINKKLDEVIAAVKDINVYMDGRKVNENIARNTSTSKET